jgi:hypothetical protein
MDDHAFLPTEGQFFRGGIWERQEEEVEEPADSTVTGDVSAVDKEIEKEIEKELEANLKDDIITTDQSGENSESADSPERLEPKPKMKNRARSPAMETVKPEARSEQNLRGRLGRSSSITSVSSAPAVVATDLINVVGTSPGRDNVDWAAEASARALAQRVRANEIPKLNANIPTDVVEPFPPVSHQPSRSLDDTSKVTDEKSENMSGFETALGDGQSTPPDPAEDASSIKSTSRTFRTSSMFGEKDQLFSTRVSQATGVAKDMFKSRLSTYLAKRQQTKLQKQILSNDHDLLVNSIKPRTHLPTEIVTATIDSKPDVDDIDSGPLPFDNRRPAVYAPGEYSPTTLASPGYGPSAMMTIPSTMANARPPSSSSSSAPAPPPFPPRTISKRPVPPPPLPPRSAPQPIPRRPVPLPPRQSETSLATTPDSPGEPKGEPDPRTDNDDLLLMQLSEDESDPGQSGESSSSQKESNLELGCSPERRKARREEEAVLEPSSFGSNTRSSVKESNIENQWNEKQVSDTEMPEMMAEGLMG